MSCKWSVIIIYLFCFSANAANELALSFSPSLPAGSIFKIQDAEDDDIIWRDDLGNITELPE